MREQTAEQTALLAGRLAKCDCGATKPSHINLPFFEFQGENSDRARTSCKNCPYFDTAHTDEVRARNPRVKCINFEPHGAYEFDRMYCGCRGWD